MLRRVKEDLKVTSIKTPKTRHAKFKLLCKGYGVPVTTGLNWLIQDAVNKKALPIPNMTGEESTPTPKFDGLHENANPDQGAEK